MPHVARRRSGSGYYHVVSKGIADQLLFESDVDRRYYRQLLREAKVEADSNLHAYCLMSNHVHLIIEARGEMLSRFMKLVDERYGRYYADKTGRRGGVFRKPFWSEPIETDEYLLCAVRYVHANPATAGICAASAYDWSSAKDYLGRTGESCVADTAMVLDMCDGVDGFIRFSRENPMPGIPFAGSRLSGHLSDDEALRVAKAVVGEEEIAHAVTYDRSRKIMLVHKLKDAGLIGKQIIRVTGLGRSFVYGAVRTGGSTPTVRNSETGGSTPTVHDGFCGG